MATVPTSATHLFLYDNINWNHDYQATRWFDKKSDQEKYFDSRNVIYQTKNATFLKAEGQSRVAIGKNVDHLNGVNYMAFKNDTTINKWFYAFVTSMEYENKHTTWIYFTIDVVQTYMFDITFKPTFMVREHQKLWTDKDDKIPVIFSQQDEGIDYGDEYETVYAKHIKRSDMRWFVMVSKTPLHKGSDADIAPTNIGRPQPLSYYVIPFVSFDQQMEVEKGNDDHKLSTPKDVLKGFYGMEKATNNLVSLYITDNIGGDFDYSKGVESGEYDKVEPSSDLDFDVVDIEEDDEKIKAMYVENFSYFQAYQTKVLDNKYEHFRDSKESRLLQSPYAITILDDFRGNRMTIKHENIKGEELHLLNKGSLGTSNKTSWSVRNYNTQDDIGDAEDIERLSNEKAIIDDSPNDIAIVNDQLAAFLQGNKNSLNTERKNRGMQNWVDLGTSTAGGVSRGFTGGPYGAIAGGASGLVEGGLGFFDSHMETQQEEAQMKDIDDTPPDIQKMGSNTAYDEGNGYTGVWLIQKQVKSEVQTRLEDYFHMFGYKANRVKKPNLHTRQTFNFVKTKFAGIHGKINMEDKQQLQAIFDKGITLWHTNDVGNYDKDNEVID